MNKRYKGYWRDLVAAANRSRVIVLAIFWTIVTTAGEHITSLSGVVDSKYYPYIMMGTIALARMRGLSKDLKIKQALK